jgi:predicted phosphodiesterase
VRLGILSDIHGNRIALEAVLADGDARGVDAWWALGDLVAMGPDPVAAAALAGAAADIVIAGHTHQATDRTVGAIRAVNPGSVSNPVTDDLRAGYVIVHSDRSGHRVEHLRVDYDRDAFLDRLRESGYPSPDFLAAMFRRGG